MAMTEAERLVKARRALFELEEIVLDVLIEEKLSSNPKALYPYEIGHRANLTILQKPFYGDNPHSLVWGVLDSLASEGRVEHRADGAWMIDDLD